MTLLPADLLAGPRARRLCLEFALSSWESLTGEAQELRAAIMEAAYDLDPGRGIGRVRFGAGPAVPQILPEHVRRLLQTVPLADADERALLFSLKAAVDSARYWQQPDGEDVLAETPEVRAGLERIAAAIVASPAAAWWSAAIDLREQWTVTFEGAGEPTTLTAFETLDRYHAAQVDEERSAASDRPTDPRAAFSGGWWSRPPLGLPRTTRSLPGRGPVALWLVEDALRWNSATADEIDVPADPRIFEIDGPDAWAELCQRYPLEVTASRRHDWYRTTGRSGHWVIPDWAKVRHDFDAVHLTIAGYLTTTGRAIDVDGDRASVLAGWDPDQTHWLCDISRKTSTHQDWSYYSSHDGFWEPAIGR